MAKPKRKAKPSDSLPVVYDPDAYREYAEVADKKERFSIQTAVAKLRAVGTNLPYPHSSAVKGSSEGVRELRPRAGNSPYRPLYRRFGDSLIVLAIAHKDNFAAQVAIADQRAGLYQKDD
jgi:hypothetical protein